MRTNEVMERLRHPVFPGIIFFALWLDGTFYPLLLVPLLYVLTIDPEGLRSLGLGRESGFVESLRLGVLALAGVMAAWLIPLVVYQGWESSPNIISLLKDVLWFPFYEEVAYRGFFLSQIGLRLLKREWVANVIQASLFVAVHHHFVSQGTPLRIVPVFVLGILLGLIFIKTRNLYGCLLCHALANLIANFFLIALR